ncbi:MAG: sigma 54-interacting transcriptional regulator [Planctomycetota bacterium]
MSKSFGALVVDDEAYVRDSISRVLASEGWRADTAADVDEALARLGSVRFDVVVSDLSMPGGDVFALLDGMRAAGDRTPVVVITGVGTVKQAVAAMKSGAHDFLQKPVDPEELLVVARRAAEHRRMVSEFEDLRAADRRRRSRRVLVGSSESMQRVRRQIEHCAETSSNVLVTGESGTGKSLVAEALLAAAGGNRSLVRVRCANATPELLEEELGPRGVRGARLAEAGGVVALDDVGLARPEVQERLLALVESDRGDAPVRFVATTNANLEEAVAAGNFRGDLFYRLAVLRVTMPPLRGTARTSPRSRRTSSRPGTTSRSMPTRSTC